jgi:HSP20 family protein
MAETATVPVKKEEERITRRQPRDLFAEMQEEMARLWEDGWPWPLARPFRRHLPKEAMWAPRADIFEKNGAFVVKAELPGVNKEDVEVALDDGQLVIKGERKAETEVKEEDYYRMERTYGTFYRRMALPFETTAAQIEATFKDGVLEVKIPKPVETKVEPKKIAIT